MKHPEPEISVVSLADQGFEGNLTTTWEKDYPVIARRVESTPLGAIVGLDLRANGYLGFSYAKGTVRKLLRRQIEGDLGGRRLVVLSRFDDAFLDGLEQGLALINRLMLCIESEESAARSAKVLGAKGRGGDEISTLLQDTVDVLLRQGPCTTGQVADALGITPQNAKNRFDRLVESGLVIREKVDSSSGGKEWLNRLW